MFANVEPSAEIPSGGPGDQGTGGPGDPGGPGSALPTCDQVSPGMPWCGDGVCDGPETDANCAADC